MDCDCCIKCGEMPCYLGRTHINFLSSTHASFLTFLMIHICQWCTNCVAPPPPPSLDPPHLASHKCPNTRICKVGQWKCVKCVYSTKLNPNIHLRQLKFIIDNFLLFTFFLYLHFFFAFFSNKNYQVREIHNQKNMLVVWGG
jgi:hypothetical protein